jgi:hypothetical protein
MMVYKSELQSAACGFAVLNISQDLSISEKEGFLVAFFLSVEV